MANKGGWRKDTAAKKKKEDREAKLQERRDARAQRAAEGNTPEITVFVTPPPVREGEHIIIRHNGKEIEL